MFGTFLKEGEGQGAQTVRLAHTAACPKGWFVAAATPMALGSRAGSGNGGA